MYFTIKSSQSNFVLTLIVNQLDMLIFIQILNINISEIKIIFLIFQLFFHKKKKSRLIVFVDSTITYSESKTFCLWDLNNLLFIPYYIFDDKIWHFTKTSIDLIKSQQSCWYFFSLNEKLLLTYIRTSSSYQLWYFILVLDKVYLRLQHYQDFDLGGSYFNN